MDNSLEERFTRFIEALPNAESIDRLPWPEGESGGKRKADFLLGQRSVIVELKSLTKDTSSKIESIVDRHRDREEFPIIFGRADLRKTLAHLPDGEAIYRSIYFALTRSVEDAVRSAEAQIADTREVLELPDAASMLVILNEGVDILDPEMVGYRVAQLMRRERTGKSNAEPVDFVWLLFESHIIGSIAGMPTLPLMLIRGPGADRFPWFRAFSSDLLQRWAKTQGHPLFEVEGMDPQALRYQSLREAVSLPPKELPRQEVWRKQYRLKPYLRPLSDEDLVAHGCRLIQDFMPCALVNGTGFDEQRDRPLLERLAHFFEEAAFRALDMRRMKDAFGGLASAGDSSSDPQP